MKVNVKIPSTEGNNLRTKGAIQPTPKSNISFKSLYDAIAAKQSAPGLNIDMPIAQIAKIKQALIDSKTINPKELLLYQIQISELNMRVELLSKAADSAVALTRKLQNAQ